MTRVPTIREIGKMGKEESDKFTVTEEQREHVQVNMNGN